MGKTQSTNAFGSWLQAFLFTHAPIHVFTIWRLDTTLRPWQHPIHTSNQGRRAGRCPPSTLTLVPSRPPNAQAIRRRGD